MVGHRYYNPEWGRWIQPDDIEYLDPTNINGLNLYAYCMNDPVNMYDPDGHIAISISAIIIGAAIGFGSVYLSDVVENIKVDGFQFLDLATINKENIFEYFVNTIGGALTGLIGVLGINFLVSAPLVGAINTGVAALTGEVSTWKEATQHFAVSTLLAALTLGGQRSTGQFKNPKISRGLPTKFNRFLEKGMYVFEKIGYHYGKNADTAVGVLMMIYGAM